MNVYRLRYLAIKLLLGVGVAYVVLFGSDARGYALKQIADSLGSRVSIPITVSAIPSDDPVGGIRIVRPKWLYNLLGDKAVLSRFDSVESIAPTSNSLLHEQPRHPRPRLPASIVIFHELRYLDMTKWETTDKDLAVLSSFPHLEWIAVTGEHVTDDGLAGLRGVKSLREIWVGGTSVSFRRSDNPLSGTGVQVVHAGYANVSDEGFEALMRLPGLKILSVPNSQITHIPSVGNEVTIEKLRISGNPVVAGGLQGLLDYKNLTWLDIHGSLIDDSSTKVISQLRNLRYVDLSDTNMSMKGIASLVRDSNLRHLTAMGIECDPVSFATICTSRSLRSFEVRPPSPRLSLESLGAIENEWQISEDDSIWIVSRKQ